MELREPIEAHSRAKRTYDDYKFWFLWVLATAIPFGPGSVIAIIVSLPYSSRVVPISMGVIIFGSVGVLQWLVLRNWLQKVEGWVLVTLFGWSLGWYFGVYIVGGQGGWHINEIADSIIGSTIIGAIVGFLQFLVLRVHIKRSSLWIITTTISVVIGRVIAGYFVTEGYQLDYFWIYLSIIGLIIGICSGLSMVLLMKNTKVD